MKPERMSHQARFWHTVEKEKSSFSGISATKNHLLQCDLCPHHCILKDGQAGLCKSRVNRQGILYAESYGKVCALAVDPVEKKPLLHFYPGTQCLSIASAGCNLQCRNCQNWEISQVSPDKTSYREISPEEFINIAQHHLCPSVAYTYTEPLTWFEYLLDCCKKAHEKGLNNILVSAGYIEKEPLKELCPYLDAANIDLKSFDDTIYLQQNGAHLQPVLNTLLMLKANNVWLEITNLVIPGVNDNPEIMGTMCHWLYENGFADTPLHFSRFFPSFHQKGTAPTPLQTLFTAKDIAHRNGLKYVYLGNTGETEED